MRNTLRVARLLIQQMLMAMNPFNVEYADQKKRNRAIVRALGVAAIILMGCGSVILLEYELWNGLRGMHQPLMLPGLAVLVGMIGTLMLGFFQGLSELYQGKDSVFLAVLPITSRQVFAARLIALYVSELALNLLLMAPAFVMYGMEQGTAWPYALTGLLVFLLSPMIPMALVAAVASLLMRVSGFARHRETVVMALSMVLALAYSFAVTRFNTQVKDEEGMQMIMAMMASDNGIIKKMLDFFPPARWGVEGFTGNWGMLALLCAASIGAMALVWLIFGGEYLPMALSASEVSTAGGKRKASGKVDLRGQTTFRALHRLEWRMLLRTPSWAMNSFFGLLIFPLMMTVGFASGFTSGAGVEIRQIVPFLLDATHPVFLCLGCAAMVSMITMINPACSTAVSREGGNWPFALTLPVRQTTRLWAKLAQGEEINVIGTLLMIIPLVLFGSPWWLILVCLVAANLLGLISNAASLALDARRPQLKWINETQAIKKNYHQLIGMAIWAVLIGLSVVITIALVEKPTLAAVCVSALIVLGCAVSLWMLKKAGDADTDLDV